MANNPHNDVHTKVIQPYAIGIDADWVSNLLLPLWKELPCLHDILINAWHADIVNFRAFFGRAIADFGNAIYVIVPVHTDIADSIDVNTGKKRAFSLMISYDMYYPLNRVYLINGTPDEILNCPGRRHWAQSWDFDNKTYRDSIIEITPGITDKISRGLAWHPFDIIHHYSTIATAIGVGLSGTIVKKENMRVEPTLSAEIY